MSRFDGDDYIDLDNFDDSIGRSTPRAQQIRHKGRSRSKNRAVYRQSQRSQHSGGRSAQRSRSAYNARRRKAIKQRQFRNRVVIIAAGLLILMLLIVLVTFMFRGCTSKSDEIPQNISTEIKEKQEASSKAEEEPEAIKEQTAFKEPEIKDDDTSGELLGNLYVWHNAGYPLYNPSEGAAESYAQAVNNIGDKLDGTDIYSVIIPNRTEMGLPKRLKDGEAQSASQAEMITAVDDKLSEKVKPINVYNDLAEHNGEYIYLNTDEYWTSLGAYYGYSAFAKAAKLTALKLDDCTEQKLEGYTGSFTLLSGELDSDTLSIYELPYSVTMDVTGSDGSEESYETPYYMYAQPGTYTFAAYLMGDNPLSVLKSEAEGAKGKILVVKDSGGNNFVPFLTANYSEVHAVDLYSFAQVKGDLAQYCSDNGIDDVIILSEMSDVGSERVTGLLNGLCP